MEDFKFSIIIPTYNEENDIRGTLESLLELTYKNKEIIIVDDSNDNTPNIIREYSEQGVKLVIPELRRGRCEARNIGIRESIGDILVILNADVILPNDFLEKIKTKSPPLPHLPYLGLDVDRCITFSKKSPSLVLFIIFSNKFFF